MTNIEILNVIEDALLYWEEIEKMSCVIDRCDINISKPNRRFNQTQNLILNTHIKQVKDKDFKRQNSEQTFQKVRTFYNEIFSGEYDKEIVSFESKTKAIVSNEFSLFDGGISYTTDYKTRTKQVSKIRIYSLNSLHSCICLSHEDMHGLLYLNPIEEGSNSNELLPILIEKIMAYKLDNELDDNILLKTQAIRMKCLQEQTKEYRSILPFFMN